MTTINEGCSEAMATAAADVAGKVPARAVAPSFATAAPARAVAPALPPFVPRCKVGPVTADTPEAVLNEEERAAVTQWRAEHGGT